MLLPLTGFRIWAEMKMRRTGGQRGTVVIWPGAQDQGLQAAHIRAEPQFPHLQMRDLSLKVWLSLLGMQGPRLAPGAKPAFYQFPR